MKRIPKSVSFSDNEYERELLAYATKPEHGPFSQYVKRLIEADRRRAPRKKYEDDFGEQGVPLPEDDGVYYGVEPTPNRPSLDDEDKAAARSFI